MKLKKEEQALKNTQKAVIATKVTKAKPNTKVSEKLKETRRALAELRKKKVLHTTVQDDETRITSGRGRLLHFCTMRACPVL